MSYIKLGKPEGFCKPFLNKADFKRVFPFFYVENNFPLGQPVTVLTKQILLTSDFLLKYILISWPSAIAAGINTTPQLSYELIDINDKVFQNVPVLIRNMTSPAGLGSGLDFTMPINWLFRRRQIMTLRIRGQAGGDPANINVTFYGFHEGIRRL